MSFLPIVDEIQATFDCGIWFPALSTVLLLPDACGAIDTPTLKPSLRYITWFDKYVTPKYPAIENIKFDGEVIYKFRNAAIHENIGFARGAFGYDRIIFQPPTSFASFDRTVMQKGGDDAEAALFVSLQNFIKNMCEAVIEWEAELADENSSDKLHRLSKLVKLHPRGISPHVFGFPLIG